MQTRKPVAVLISDIHFNITTLDMAKQALMQAVTRANEENLSLIIAGDLHDTKANLRGECVKAMLDCVKAVNTKSTFILRGNHDAINEKSEEHSLEFLKPYARVIEKPNIYYVGPSYETIRVNFIPYQHDKEKCVKALMDSEKTLVTVMHQGLESSQSGDYIQDKSAITRADVAGLRVISGHYHTRQTIDLPDGGQWDYIGNPFSLNYAEANDPPKGFQVLYNDGSLEFVPTNLRKHVVLEATVIDDGTFFPSTAVVNPGDLVKVKLTGPRERLTWSKNDIQHLMGLAQDFKLELIPLNTNNPVKPELNVTGVPLLDSIIDGLQNTSGERKERLKALWKAKV